MNVMYIYPSRMEKYTPSVLQRTENGEFQLSNTKLMDAICCFIPNNVNIMGLPEKWPRPIFINYII